MKRAANQKTHMPGTLYAVDLPSKSQPAFSGKAISDMAKLLSRCKQHKCLSSSLGFILVLALEYLLLRGSPLARLIGFFSYMSVACTMIPLPTPPAVMGMGETFPAYLVALIGAIGNCLASFIEYKLVLWVCSKTELEEKMERIKLFRKFAHYFNKAAFTCLVISGFTPIPFDPFRYAAILTRYPMHRYLLAAFTSRFPSYFFAAWMGHWLAIPVEWIALMLIVLFVVPVVAGVMGAAWRKRPLRRQEI
jgi:membrane protein YqaA with SNARE-associated domain